MDCDQILPNLYVGECPTDTDDVQTIKKQAGITAVLNLQTDRDFEFWNIDWRQLESTYREQNVEVRRVPIADFSRDGLSKSLAECISVLQDLLDAGHTVYLHCTAGINRSPSVAITYIHWVMGWDLGEAFNHVQRCRSCDPYLDSIQAATEARGTKADPT